MLPPEMARAVGKMRAENEPGPTPADRSWQRSELPCTNPVKQIARGNERLAHEFGPDLSWRGRQGVGDMADRPGLVLVHGRSQQMPPSARRGAAEERAFVARKRQAWLGGLTKGLVLAGLPVVEPARVSFPYYGNAFVDAISAHDRAGRARPDLVLEPGAEPPAGDVHRPPPSAAALILETAVELGYTPDRDTLPDGDDVGALDADGVDPDVAAAWDAYLAGAGFDLGDLLRPRLLRSALQYIARKTGATELIIEQFLTDVGYYLDVPAIRDLVLGIVADDVRKAADRHGSVVLVAHSLGSIVGYDVFDTLAGEVDVRMVVTCGSPLGFPVVRGELRPSGGQRGAPAAKRGPVPWLNAYDVRDFVCLIHPLRDHFGQAPRDERTFNAGDPHSIEDYLADPDVARPVGRALQGRAPW
jgi:hypothetical protein